MVRAMRAPRFGALRLFLLPLLVAAAPAPAAAPPHAREPVMAWIDDDYAKAREQARERKLPIFVESWAPW
jgi:endonuclease YncB( thermonuclease family)